MTDEHGMLRSPYWFKMSYFYHDKIIESHIHMFQNLPAYYSIAKTLPKFKSNTSQGLNQHLIHNSLPPYHTSISRSDDICLVLENYNEDDNEHDYIQKSPQKVSSKKVKPSAKMVSKFPNEIGFKEAKLTKKQKDDMESKFRKHDKQFEPKSSLKINKKDAFKEGSFMALLAGKRKSKRLGGLLNSDYFNSKHYSGKMGSFLQQDNSKSRFEPPKSGALAQTSSGFVLKPDRHESQIDYAESAHRKFSFDEQSLDADQKSERNFKRSFNRSFDDSPIDIYQDERDIERSESDAQMITDDEADAIRKTSYHMIQRKGEASEKDILSATAYLPSDVNLTRSKRPRFSFDEFKGVNKGSNGKIQMNGMICRWNDIYIPRCVILTDDRVLYNSTRIVEMFSDEWESLVDVPLLPLTTGYAPTDLENKYKQMNPSSFDEQIKKKDLIELTVQRLTQNFQLVSQDGSLYIDTKTTITMSLCNLYYQVKNKKCNLYTPETETMRNLYKNFEVNYLYFEPTVDCFIPKYTNCTLFDPTTAQNFNDDYLTDFENQSIIFPCQNYVILYTK